MLHRPQASKGRGSVINVLSVTARSVLRNYQASVSRLAFFRPLRRSKDRKYTQSVNHCIMCRYTIQLRCP